MSNFFTAIAACDANSGIGLENTLPWKLPEDMRRFKELTTGHVVIMGRRTFESMGGKPLPNRFNIVIGSKAQFADDPTQLAFVDSIHKATALAVLMTNAKEIFVIGGAGIYNAFLNFGYIERILLTQIEEVFICDTQFPPLKGEDWEEISRERHTNDRFAYSFVEYKRIK